MTRLANQASKILRCKVLRLHPCSLLAHKHITKLHDTAVQTNSKACTSPGVMSLFCNAIMVTCIACNISILQRHYGGMDVLRTLFLML